MKVTQEFDVGNKYRTPAGDSWVAAKAVKPGIFRFECGQRVTYHKIHGVVTERRITSIPAGEGWQRSNGYVVTADDGTRYLADETSLEVA